MGSVEPPAHLSDHARADLPDGFPAAAHADFGDHAAVGRVVATYRGPAGCGPTVATAVAVRESGHPLPRRAARDELAAFLTGGT